MLPESPAKHPAPIVEGTSREATELLDFLYERYGKTTLSGQHNQPFQMSVNSDKVRDVTGKTPVVWGGEWGFSDERRDIDNVKYPPRLMEQIREQNRAGRIVCLTYHQASPTVGEPCDFKGGAQVEITDADWEAILTDGTSLNKVWAEHVDRLAEALKTLQKENVPVIFRP